MRILLPLFCILALSTPALAEEVNLLDYTPEAPRILALAAPDGVEPQSPWQFGGWSSAGLTQGLDGSDQEAFAHGYVLTTAGAEAGPGLFGLRPFAVDTYSLQLGSGEGFTDATFYITLGESDNWALVTKGGDGSPDATAAGVAYWVDAFQVDAFGQRWQPIQVQALLTESGNPAVGVKGWWGLDEKSPFNYLVMANLTYEPEGNSRGFVSLRHHTEPDLSQFIELGVYNDQRTAVFASFGASF